MRRDGEVSITEAAQRLEVHEDTIRRWVVARLGGSRSKLRRGVRKDVGNRYWLQRADVESIAADVEELNAIQHAERVARGEALSSFASPVPVRPTTVDAPTIRQPLRSSARK